MKVDQDQLNSHIENLLEKNLNVKDNFFGKYDDFLVKVKEEALVSENEYDDILLSSAFLELYHLYNINTPENELADYCDSLKLSKAEKQRTLAYFNHAKDANEQSDTVAKIVSDASHAFISSPDFIEFLLKENDIDHAKEKLGKYHYLSEAGNKILTRGTKSNDKKIKKLEKDLKKYIATLEKENSKLRQKTNVKSDRGIETMFRLTSTNHVRLSGMADNKSNIMISINAILLSILLTLFVRKADDYPLLVYPLMTMNLTSVITIIFAVLATRPNVTAGMFKREDVEKNKTNPLFFGNFHNMPVEDYEWAMKRIMRDSDLLYSSLIKDIYYLGVVLGRKYKYLRICYNIFVIGLVISTIFFLIVLHLTNIQGADLLIE